MIVYKDVFRLLNAAGYSTYRIQKEKILSGSTLNRLRNNQPVSTETIGVICALCRCQPGDFMRYETRDR